MRKIRVVLIALIVVLLGTVALCQAPVARAAEQPETIPLDKEHALALQLAVTEVENLELKANLQRMRIQRYIEQIAKPGYVVRKGQDGNWEYAKVKETK
jgi:hypothetical protein